MRLRRRETLAASKENIDLAKSYLASIKKERETGSATEHTYRSALKGLIQSLRPDVVAINEPKHVSCGAPDFVIKKRDLIVGHIEAKDIGKSLDEAEKSEQLERTDGGEYKPCFDKQFHASGHAYDLARSAQSPRLCPHEIPLRTWF